jgi:hypothetical protein
MSSELGLKKNFKGIFFYLFKSKPDKLELKVPKPDKPEPRRACLEITNYKSQITKKIQIPISKLQTILIDF